MNLGKFEKLLKITGDLIIFVGAIMFLNFIASMIFQINIKYNPIYFMYKPIVFVIILPLYIYKFIQIISNCPKTNIFYLLLRIFLFIVIVILLFYLLASFMWLFGLFDCGCATAVDY